MTITSDKRPVTTVSELIPGRLITQQLPDRRRAVRVLQNDGFTARVEICEDSTTIDVDDWTLATDGLLIHVSAS